MMHRVLTLVLSIALSLTLLPGTVLAQDAAPQDAAPQDDVMPKEERVQKQMIRLMTSDDAHQEGRALEIVLHRARTADASFFTPVTPYVADLVETGRTENVQVMATVTLYRIGTPDAQRLLAETTPNVRSYRVRSVASRLLSRMEADRTLATAQPGDEK